MSGQYLSAARGQSSFDALNIGSRQLVPHSGISCCCVSSQNTRRRRNTVQCAGLNIPRLRPLSLSRFRQNGFQRNVLPIRRRNGAKPSRDVSEHLIALLLSVSKFPLKQLHETKVSGVTSSIKAALQMSEFGAQCFEFDPIKCAHW